jgi:hypothetical protein
MVNTHAIVAGQDRTFSVEFREGASEERPCVVVDLD